MAIYQLRSGGVWSTVLGALVPEQAGNRHWNEYQAWLAGGNTPDPLPTTTVSMRRAIAKVTLDEQARALIGKVVPRDAGEVWLDQQTHAQAVLADADGSITGGEYPLLEALVPEMGANVGEVADAVIAARAARITTVAAIEDERSRVRALVAVAVDQTAIDTAMAGLTWPVVP
jgi:hypothetical protein